MKFKNLVQSFIKQGAGDVIFKRGQEYYECGMVEELDYNPDTESIDAEVSGNYGDYEVRIASKNNKIDAECTCPYDGYPCKHIVAVLLTFISEQRKYTQQALKKKKEASGLTGRIAKLSKEELAEMVCSCIKKYPDFKRDVMVRLGKNKQATVDMLLKQINQAFPSIISHHYSSHAITKQLDLILNSVENASDKIKIKIYWAIVERTLDELNEYGMDDEPLEEAVVDSLEMLTEILKDDKSLKSDRQNTIKLLLNYYTHNNCGMGDFIYDAAEELCLDKSDYKIIIDALEKELLHKSSKSYYQGLLAKLYCVIGDTEATRKTLEGHLEYGMDYWRLAQFWLQQGKKDKTLDVVKEGLEKGEGRKTELYTFLQEYYEKQSQYNHILQMLKTKIAKKDLDRSGYQQDSTYQCLWRHYVSEKNYQGQKNLLELRLADNNIEMDFYKQAEKVLNSKDWTLFEKKIIAQLKEVSGIKQREKLSQIYAYKKNLPELFEIVKSDNHLLVKYESKLASKHPEVYLKRYNEMIEKLIAYRGRENYRIAANYAERLKKIYQKILKKPQEWSWYIGNLKSKNKILRALQEELCRKNL